MHWLYWVYISIFFSVSYRIGYKLISDKFSPLFNAAIITFIASIVCLTLYLWQDYSKNGAHELTIKAMMPLLALGVILGGLELSILMIYRSGGPVSIAQALASGTVGIIVFSIGLLYFKDQLNLGQIIGFILGIIGTCMMIYYSKK